MPPGPLCEFLDLLLVHGQLRGPRRPVPRDPVHGVVLQFPPATAAILCDPLTLTGVTTLLLLLLLHSLPRFGLGLGGVCVDHPELVLLLLLFVAEVKVVDVAPSVGPLHREFVVFADGQLQFRVRGSQPKQTICWAVKIESPISILDRVRTDTQNVKGEPEPGYRFCI